MQVSASPHIALTIHPISSPDGQSQSRTTRLGSGSLPTPGRIHVLLQSSLQPLRQRNLTENGAPRTVARTWSLLGTSAHAHSRRRRVSDSRPPPPWPPVPAPPLVLALGEASRLFATAPSGAEPSRAEQSRAALPAPLWTPVALSRQERGGGRGGGGVLKKGDAGARAAESTGILPHDYDTWISVRPLQP